MIKRLISSAIIIPILLLIIWNYIPIGFTALILVSALLLVHEIISMAPIKLRLTTKIITFSSVVIFYIIKYLSFFVLHMHSEANTAALIICFLIIFIIGIIYTFYSTFDDFFVNMQFALLAFFIGGFLLSLSIDIRFINVMAEQDDMLKNVIPQGNGDLHLGAYYYIYILTTAWMYDAGAYFTGKYLGKKKLGLSSSPNKSWAGFIGGLIAAPIGMFILSCIIKKLDNGAYSLSIFSGSTYPVIIGTIILAVFSQFGDFLESVMKRSAKIKDSGKILIGHGGIFDAVDSALVGTIIFYIYIKYLHGFLSTGHIFSSPY
jgi:CDP-diglyceride synthetase